MKSLKLLGTLCAVGVFMGCALSVQAMTDEERERYRQQSPEFNAAEVDLSNSWKALMAMLPEIDRRALIEEQRLWIRFGRAAFAQEMVARRNLTPLQGQIASVMERARLLKLFLRQKLAPDTPVQVIGRLKKGNDGSAAWLLHSEEFAQPFRIPAPATKQQFIEIFDQSRESGGEVLAVGYLEGLSSFSVRRPVLVSIRTKSDPASSEVAKSKEVKPKVTSGGGVKSTPASAEKVAPVKAAATKEKSASGTASAAKPAKPETPVVATKPAPQEATATGTAEKLPAAQTGAPSVAGNKDVSPVMQQPDVQPSTVAKAEPSSEGVAVSTPPPAAAKQVIRPALAPAHRPGTAVKSLSPDSSSRPSSGRALPLPQGAAGAGE